MTTKTFLTTTALGLLLATSTVAQTTTETPPAPAEDTAPTDGTAPMADDMMTDADMMEPQTLEEMTVGDLTGTDVIDANGDSIGSIQNVVQGGTEAEAVVGIGGFLGIGRYDVALPLSDLNYNPEDQSISVTLTREELEALPEYTETDVEPLPAETPLSSMIMAPAATDAPTTTDAPATDAPAMDAPAMDAPAMDDPAMDDTGMDAMDSDATDTDAGTDETTTNN